MNTSNRYSVQIRRENERQWDEVGYSSSFADAWEFARVQRQMAPKAEIKIVGSEGVWNIK